MNNEDALLLGFKAISNFTCELGDLFGARQKSLKLYARLIKATTLNHDVAIKKHVEAFRLFCFTNREAIISKNHERLSGNVIYSDRVFIDIQAILTIADAETRSAIWKHILCISALVDPAGKAKQVLREQMESKENGGEADFLVNLISKIETHVDPNADPMTAISSIMSSGVFTELVGGMNDGLSNGTLDLNKMMSTVQGMMGSLGAGTGAGSDASAMLSGMMGKMGAAAAAIPTPTPTPTAAYLKRRAEVEEAVAKSRAEKATVREQTPSPPAREVSPARESPTREPSQESLP